MNESKSYITVTKGYKKKLLSHQITITCFILQKMFLKKMQWWKRKN